MLHQHSLPWGDQMGRKPRGGGPEEGRRRAAAAEAHVSPANWGRQGLGRACQAPPHVAGREGRHWENWEEEERNVLRGRRVV